MNDRRRLDVYVRLGNGGQHDTSREMSFPIPDGVSQTELLEHGFAIDGNNSALMGVKGYFDDDINSPVSLAETLVEDQKALVRWLGKKGYEVTFK